MKLKIKQPYFTRDSKTWGRRCAQGCDVTGDRTRDLAHRRPLTNQLYTLAPVAIKPFKTESRAMAFSRPSAWVSGVTTCLMGSDSRGYGFEFRWMLRFLANCWSSWYSCVTNYTTQLFFTCARYLVDRSFIYNIKNPASQCHILIWPLGFFSGSYCSSKTCK